MLPSWDTLEAVRALARDTRDGDSERDAQLMVALDGLSDLVKCGLDISCRVESLLETLLLPLSLPNVVLHISALFSLCHVLRATVALPDADKILERTGVMPCIVRALASPKREVRDAAGQALGAAGVKGAEALLAEIEKTTTTTTAPDNTTWEAREGQAMALGYVGAVSTGEVRAQLLDRLVPLLKLVSSESSAMAGNGAVLQHACRSVFCVAKGSSAVGLPDDIVSAVEGLLCHRALEVRREAALAVSETEGALSKAIEAMTNNESCGKESVDGALRLHGWVLVVRELSSSNCCCCYDNDGDDDKTAEKTLLLEKALPLLLNVVSRHLTRVEGDEKEEKERLPPEASFAAGDALRASVNIALGCKDAAKERSLFQDLAPIIRRALSSPDTVLVDAALRTVQVLSKATTTTTDREKKEESILTSLVKDALVWVFALQFHPAIVVRVAAVEVLGTLEKQGLYDEDFGLAREEKDDDTKPLVSQMLKFVLGFIEEGYTLLKKTTSNDMRETILRASLAMFKRLAKRATEKDKVELQTLVESDETGRALLEDFALLVIDKAAHGFVGEDGGSFDFARPSASECLEAFPLLFGEDSVVVEKLADPELLVPLAFIPDDVSSGVVRMLGVLAERYPGSLPMMGFLALILGVSSPIPATGISALSVLPALGSSSSISSVVTDSLIDGLTRHLVSLSLGDTSSELEVPLDPFMCTSCLAVLKYAFLKGKESASNVCVEASYSLAVTAVLTALCEGSDEFKAKEFAAAILLETDLDGLSKAHPRWGDVVGLFLSKLADTENDGDVQMEYFPDSGEIEAEIDNLSDVVGEDNLEGKFKEVVEKFRAMSGVDVNDGELPENEKLVWSIVNKKYSMELEDFPIYSSFALSHLEKQKEDTKEDKEEEDIGTVKGAINFLQRHRGELIPERTLERLSSVLLDEDIGDDERLLLVPVLLTAGTPSLPLVPKVLGEAKRNEGFATDSLFAAMR